ncbi:MAG: hypothetical protein ACR2PR_10295, partial [Pseudohongiellaceae bacterium]
MLSSDTCQNSNIVNDHTPSLSAPKPRRLAVGLFGKLPKFIATLVFVLGLGLAPQVQAQFSPVPELDLLRSSDTGNPTDNNTSIGTPVFSVGNLVGGGTVTVTATWNDAPGGSAYDNISKSFV